MLHLSHNCSTVQHLTSLSDFLELKEFFLLNAWCTKTSKNTGSPRYPSRLVAVKTEPLEFDVYPVPIRST